MFKILDGRDKFYQWDSNRKLIVEDNTIVEVHFCNRTDDCSLVCETYTEDGLTVVNVPNILLQTDWKIRVYAFDVSYTKYEKCFEVVSRTKPADYVYEETEEIIRYKYLSNRINVLEEKAVEVDSDISNTSTNPVQNKIVKKYVDEENLIMGARIADVSRIADDAKQIAENANIIAKGKASGYVFDTEANMRTWLEVQANVTKLIQGDNLYIRDIDVPDYWWDGAEAQQLETQKVDLTEYAQKEEVNNKIGDIEIALDNIIAIQNKLLEVSE